DPAAQELQERVFARSDFSPRSWPREGYSMVLVGQADGELDASCRADREIVERGFRSLLRLPVGHGRAVLGSVVLVSRLPQPFTAEHGQRLALVSEMVAVALAHERLVLAWRERRRKRQALDRLVPALTGSLDVRAVFQQVAGIAREIVPHDYLSLGLV